jgi:hypothetical protein
MENKNLAALLGKPNTQPENQTPISTPVPKSAIGDTDEPISLKLPLEWIEWIRDYRYAKIIATGDTEITLREAWIDALSDLKKHTKYEIKPRPASVRQNEKKVGRKRKYN